MSRNAQRRRQRTPSHECSETDKTRDLSKKFAPSPPAKAKPDRRIERTQRSLHVALNTLILERGYEATTIKDIVSDANVGRSTLYAHHGGKEGLLLNGLQHLRRALLIHRHEPIVTPGEAKKPMLGFSRAFFEHVHEYRDILRALNGSEGGAAVTRGIKRLVADIVRNELSSSKSQARSDEIPRDAIVQFTVDALFSVLLWWFERSPRLTPGKADAIFRRLTLPALTAVGLT